MSVSANARLRLARHADYQRVYGSARKHHGRQMSFFFSPRPAERRSLTTGPRVGLTVGKVLGRAVERNRIKRRLRECIRRHAPLLNGFAVDVVLHPRRSVLVLPAAQLDSEVAAVFRTITSLMVKAAEPQA